MSDSNLGNFNVSELLSLDTCEITCLGKDCLCLSLSRRWDRLDTKVKKLDKLSSWVWVTGAICPTAQRQCHSCHLQQDRVALGVSLLSPFLPTCPVVLHSAAIQGGTRQTLQILRGSPCSSEMDFFLKASVIGAWSLLPCFLVCLRNTIPGEGIKPPLVSAFPGGCFLRAVLLMEMAVSPSSLSPHFPRL